MNEAIHHLLTEQLAHWPLARSAYEALAGVQVKELHVRGVRYQVQFNPARIRSSGAKVDARSISQRPCFLCPAHLPPEQQGIPYGGRYQILVNPFPIFPRHLTIPDLAHTPQRIGGRMGDMLDLARSLTDYTLFYNGPRCGASAPDHAHFQAGSRGFMPIEADWKNLVAGKVADYGRASLYWLADQPRATLVIQSADKPSAEHLFGLICRLLPPQPEQEPMLNVLAMYDAGMWTVVVFPRLRHRPSCYTAEGEGRLLSSPASVDLGGVFITPLESDFHRLSAPLLEQILREVCLPEDDFARLRQSIRNHLNEPPKPIQP